MELDAKAIRLIEETMDHWENIAQLMKIGDKSWMNKCDAGCCPLCKEYFDRNGEESCCSKCPYYQFYGFECDSCGFLSNSGGWVNKGHWYKFAKFPDKGSMQHIQIAIEVEQALGRILTASGELLK